MAFCAAVKVAGSTAVGDRGSTIASRAASCGSAFDSRLVFSG